MPLYLVKLRREIEWEDYYDADNEGLAKDLAKLEAQNGTIVDEQVVATEMDPAMVDQ